VPVARGLAAAARTLATTAAVAAFVIVVYVLRNGVPEGGEGRFELVIVVVLAALPPAVLAAFWLAVREVAELPARLRSLPETGRDQAKQLGEIAGHARSGRGWFRFPRLLWRFAFLVGAARDTLTPWAPLLPLLSVPFLLASAAAFVAALVEIAIAVVLVLALAL
jgi:hypothetical protein